MSSLDYGHLPVLKDAVLELTAPARANVIVDCTTGLGGHLGMLLAAAPDARLIGLDVDRSNLATAADRLKEHLGRFELVQANFAELPAVLAARGGVRADIILADLGVSSNQIADPARGLSFTVDAPLDMRLDDRLKTTAADLVNTMSEGELSDLLYFQSQERHSRRISKRICQARRQSRINSTVYLARLVASAVGENPDAHGGRIHPATRTFMALRMAVNRETESLSSLLAALPGCLAPGGRAAIISFHSVEDRLVKEDFKTRAKAGEYRLITRKPVIADEVEREVNPRSRSAKLRVAELVN